MIACSKCGYNNASGKFCVKCGSRLQPTAHEPAAHPTTIAPPHLPLDAQPDAASITENAFSVTSTAALKPKRSAVTEQQKKIIIIVAAAIIVLTIGVVAFQRIRSASDGTSSVSEAETELKSSNSVPSPNNHDISPSSVQPENWRITYDEVFARDGEPRTSLLAQLIANLESPNGEGVAITKQEFINFLSQPEANVVYYEKILKYSTPASLNIQKKEHEDYTKIFMKESYQKAGLAFLQDQRRYLDKAEQEYGVLRKDVVSILIWESGLGKYTGDFHVFNIFLGHLLFLDRAQESAVRQMIAEGNPNPLNDAARMEKEQKRLEKRKSESARNLIALLRISKQLGTNPLEVKGSWGGAIGYVQFMPANLKYAVDGDGDGKVNLSSWPDAIMSVASFLKTVGDYTPSDAGRQRALLKYNPSKEYANGVKLVADTIWKRHVNGE